MLFNGCTTIGNNFNTGGSKVAQACWCSVMENVLIYAVWHNVVFC